MAVNNPKPVSWGASIAYFAGNYFSVLTLSAVICEVVSLTGNYSCEEITDITAPIVNLLGIGCAIADNRLRAKTGKGLYSWTKIGISRFFSHPELNPPNQGIAPPRYEHVVQYANLV